MFVELMNEHLIYTADQGPAYLFTHSTQSSLWAGWDLLTIVTAVKEK